MIPGASSIGLYAWASQQGCHDINHLAYLAASLCCVGALGGLSHQTTARLGNSLGMIGVSLGKYNLKKNELCCLLIINKIHRSICK